MRNLTLEIDGHAVSAVVAYDRGNLWVHLDGETYVYEAPKKETRRAGRSGAHGVHAGEIAAPMPGKIVKILVAPGDKIITHQVLIVMEAMKMEYTLKAHADGTVSEINCASGEQVALGQILVKLKTGAEE